MLIECHATAVEPARLGVRADKNEHLTDLLFFLDTGAIVAPRHGREAFQWIAVKLR